MNARLLEPPDRVSARRTPIRILGLEKKLKELDEVAKDNYDDLCVLFGERVSCAENEAHDTIFRVAPEHGQQPAYALSNFVFQGGGVLGIAHLGFLMSMERIGVRALGTAGTSAGAILAILVAAARGVDLRSSVAERLLPILWSMPAGSFIDGPYSVRRLVKYALKRKNVASIEMTGPLLGALGRLLRTFGLNTGNAFQSWLSDVLERQFNIRTVEELEAKLNSIARAIELPARGTDLLKVVATALPQSSTASIPVGVKLTFPQDMAVLSPKYRRSSPALLARASMSVPIFFDPLVLETQHDKWSRYAEKYLSGVLSDFVLKELSSADQIAFIDGGLLSNLPIDAFLRRIGKKTDRRLWGVPTIAVTLVSGSRVKDPSRRRLNAALSHGSAVVDGMRHARDRDALALARLANRKGKAPNVVVASIDTSNHNWLNFQLDEVELSNLFLHGIDGAIRMIKSLRKLKLKPKLP